MRRITVLTFSALLLGSCAIPPRAETPMATVGEIRAPAHDTLMIFLPGRGDRAQDFEDHGWMASVADADLLAADAHLGYYRPFTLVDRLHQDVIAPARTRGYQRIVLVGISMGGTTALIYADAHPDMVDGLILIAPFLGDAELAREIDATGGLRAWSGDAESGEPYQLDSWRWLRQQIETDGDLILAYGSEDRFAATLAVLADALPASQVLVVEGGHDWGTWTQLWRTLQRGDASP
jgi:pimeloyl-ACP methyl ester carboxylesterase